MLKNILARVQGQRYRTTCLICGYPMRGIRSKCQRCESENVGVEKLL